jgi:hypothetical protein
MASMSGVSERTKSQRPTRRESASIAPSASPGISVGPFGGALIDIFDEDRRLGDQPLAVEQDGKSLQRPALLQLSAVLRMLGVEHPEFERHRMPRTARSARFLAVG